MNYTASITDYLILLTTNVCFYLFGRKRFLFAASERANKIQAENDPPVHATIENYPKN